MKTAALRACWVVGLAALGASPGVLCGCGNTSSWGLDTRSVGEDDESLDLGQNWEQQAGRPNGTRRDGAGKESAEEDRADVTRTWGIVLQTFTGDDAPYAAANVKRQLPVVAPRLASAHVKSTQTGAMLVWGAYTGPDDAHAAADLKSVKAMQTKGRPIFPKAMLAKVVDSNMTADASEFNLMSARKKYPKIDPLYSLQVAIWLTEERSAGALKRVQAQAEDYTRQLRVQGDEAYIYHDAEKRMSTVTVGVFGANAIDGASGLYSDEVEALLKKFPEHLVNGLPLEEYKNPKRPELGTQLQRPKLVLVPKM